ncbi:hypothetical protein M0R45_001882 [Rubus argutus]|uniref:Uncharacterized protein n=1 Tax=Rubus argutus TaxID=59490 RepID=A0AAW1VFE8_RUBAR
MLSAVGVDPICHHRSASLPITRRFNLQNSPVPSPSISSCRVQPRTEPNTAHSRDLSHPAPSIPAGDPIPSLTESFAAALSKSAVPPIRTVLSQDLPSRAILRVRSSHRD